MGERPWTERMFEVLSIFRGRCGHEWVGASGGSYGCPICGDHDGDHHLVSAEQIAVQCEDWGTAWEELKIECERPTGLGSLRA
jgi:hypothetical protein